MNSIRILGTGSYLPPRVFSNLDIEKLGLETNDEWIVKRTGIKERRFADDGILTSDLAYEASIKALEMAEVSAKDIGLIIFATVTPDTQCPAAANWLQAKLDAPLAYSFDITAACSGFVFGLDIATQYLKTGAVKYVLVVAAEIMSRVVNWKDRSSCILWGDGAGAAVLTKDKGGHQILSTHIHTDGANGQDLLLPGGGSSTTPITHESVDKGLHYLKLIEANASFRVAVRHFVESIKEGVSFNKLTIEEINWFIPHQANLRMFQAIAKNLNLPMEKFYITMHKYGNISSASCSIAFDEAARDGSLRKGNHVCIPVFGGGLTWGSAVIRW